MRRIAVLASGHGSNLEALHAYLTQRRRAGSSRGGEVVLVASEHRDAGALDIAGARDIETAVIGPEHEDGAAMETLFETHRVDLVVLAGYLRLVPPAVVRAYRGRMVNVHPALLPAFGGPGMYGARVHRAVLASGTRVSGVTVHFVDEVYDHGATIAQWPVPVLRGDTPQSLAARVQRVEHLLYPRAVAALADGRVALDAAGRAAWTGRRSAAAPVFALEPLEDDALGQAIDAALSR